MPAVCNYRYCTEIVLARPLAKMLSEKGENAGTKETKLEKPLSDLADWEMEVVTKVFRSFETGLREGTILPKVRVLQN